MNPVSANLETLKNRMSESWTIDSLNMQALSSSSWRTTVILERKSRDLVLQSDDRDFFEFCIAMRPSLDTAGNPSFRQFADLNRYYEDVEHLTKDTRRKTQEAVQRLVAGKRKLMFAPEALVAEFLKSRNWGDQRFLPLKTDYYDVVAVLLVLSKQAVESQERVQKSFPESVNYAKRIGDVLLQAFQPTADPIKSFLRFSEANRIEFYDSAAKLITESRFNDDIFSRLSMNGGKVDGHVGLRYLIDMYRRYVDWAFPLVKMLSDAVCTVEGGRPSPEASLGMTKRVELIRRSNYSDIVDCFDPRIRHAASHNGVAYDQSSGIVKFSGVDSDGVRKFDDFELTYVQASDKVRSFTRGFIPAILIAFGMQHQLQLLAAVTSPEFQNLLLLIGNESVH
jgi:hypothetical protein